MTKYFPAETCAQGPITAILKLVHDHSIRPEQVRMVRIQVDTRGAEHIGDPAKRYPHNKETADHSLYYLTAVAISDQNVSIDSYTDDKLVDPTIHALIGKVTVEANPELDTFGVAGIAHIYTNDNREFSCRVDYPRGHYRNRMTDDEMSEKFRTMAARSMDKAQITQIRDTVYQLEQLQDIGKLMKILVFTDTA